MSYKIGTKITDKDDGKVFVITESDANVTKYQSGAIRGECPTPLLTQTFIVDGKHFPGLIHRKAGTITPNWVHINPGKCCDAG